MRYLVFALCATLAVSLVSCDTYGNDPYEELIVVESILEALAPLPPVLLSTTAPIDAVFDEADARNVNDATIVLQRLDENGGVVETVDYRNSTRVGRYDPASAFGGGTVPLVQPRARYRLLVDVPGFDPIRAETVVPDTFTTVAAPFSPATYQSDEEQPTVRVTPSVFPERQTIYIFSILAVDQVGSPNPDNLTPLSRAIYDEFDEEDPEELNDRRQFIEEAVFGASPLLNEERYIENADGTLDVSVPWLAFSFYGFHELTASAVDDALNNFLSTQAVQFQPTTLSPGEIPNIATNIEGGLGVFGSYARSVTTVEITRE
ncbi:MAG: DUF4249 family protein [Bacteroidota bacterium]